MTTTQKAGALSELNIYLGDNGRAFCGSLRCAGMTAYYSGRDLSGQPVLRLNARKADERGIVCEGCGASASTLSRRHFQALVARERSEAQPGSCATEGSQS